ncbi:MAG: TatD family hydrolase [SAR202 cluster bacterium]|nr:TatD family hydrolase [SAR202 cluster bacterium]
MLIDTHVHLDPFSKIEIEEILYRATNDDVKIVISAGTTIESSKKNIEYSKIFPQFFTGVGIHPMDLIEPFSKNHDNELRDLVSNHEKVIVMSEIGLDYLPDMPDRAWQFDAFRKQISIARDFKLPIIFHSRDAHNDCFRVLREERAFEVGGVMHYFQGSLYDAQTAIDSGFYISIARPLFRIDELQDVVKKISLEHIVIETDSAPQPFKKNRENWTEPRHLRSILLKIAELKDLSAQEVERIIFNNTKKLLSKRWESIEATFS